VVLGLGAWLLRPTWADFVSLGLFLLASGGITLAVGWLATPVGPLAPFRTLRSKLLLLIALIAGLGLVNIGFTSYLMFISPHDLALLSILLLFSFGVSVSLAFFLSLPFNATIRTIVDAVNRMRAGHLDTRITVTTHDEFEAVAAAFNGMAEELEAAFGHQQELEQARHQLIAAVSHDLRNPLASMRAMVESINDSVVTDPGTTRRYLVRLQKDVEYLSHLIDDLFELSQINAGLIGLQLDRASLQDLVSDTLESVSAQAAQAGMTVSGCVADDLPPIPMDARRVQRVLLNLVQNALRHTPANGTIHIEVADLGPELQVVVADSGEGIAAEDLPHIFDQFYRGDAARSRDESGGGLGLSIAEGIVAAHGGRIWAESTLGHGSRFFFTLPKQGAMTGSTPS
jgi:signal transduction histidine kinase